MQGRANIHLLKSNRYCVVSRVARFNPAAVRREILQGDGVQSDFTGIGVAMPSEKKTPFKVYATPKQLLIAVCLLDLATPGKAHSEALQETVEILFNPWNDGIGYQQFLFTPGKVQGPYHFTPYEFAHSSAFSHLKVLKHKWLLPSWVNSEGHAPAKPVELDEPAWLFVWFGVNDVFRQGGTVGFNVARNSPAARDTGAWNLCSGHGIPDASSFGRLHLNAPLDWAVSDSAVTDGKSVNLKGAVSENCGITFRLLDPLGSEVEMNSVWNRRIWQIEVPAGKLSVPGTYRLYADSAAAAPEPDYISFDVILPEVQPPPVAAMTYDIPDDILCASKAYTPEILAAEFELMHAHGIRRLHWLDYTPEILYAPKWAKNNPQATATRRYCGDILPVAATLAKQKGLEFIALFKPFDIAYDQTGWKPERVDRAVPDHNVRNLEGRNVWAPEAVAANQDCTLALNPAWHPDSVPIAPDTIRLYSRTAVPELHPDDLRLWVSADNREYHPYRGPLNFRIRRVYRRHQRWSAAGNIVEPGGAYRFMLEISGLSLDSPYLALEFRTDVSLEERAHVFGEALDRNGKPVPLTMATQGSLEHGFCYWQEWKSWVNTSPRLLEDMRWGKGVHGLVFAMPRTKPTLLEPCSGKTHDIWLEYVQRILAADTDGIGIRTLCHHNNLMDYLSLAFAPAVRECFRTDFGREPEPTWADACLIREVRGRAYTRFLRKVKHEAVNAGKTLSLHLEAGIEVPPAYAQPMQLNLEWETWITEGIADALMLKLWYARNPFIQQRVLPLARRFNLPVYVIDGNNSLCHHSRCIERACALMADVRNTGMAGLAWYEACDYKYSNRGFAPAFRSHVGEAIKQSAGKTSEKNINSAK